MQKKDTGHVYAMKILRKADMLEKEQVRLDLGSGCYAFPRTGCHFSHGSDNSLKGVF